MAGALDAQSTNIDSSIAGQPFEQSLRWSEFSHLWNAHFRPQNSTLADLIAKYDPQQTSYAFSLLGLSGTPAGAAIRRIGASTARSSTTPIF